MAPRLLPNRWLSAKSIRAAVENGSRRSGGGADHVPGVCGILGTSVVEAPAEGGGADHAQEVCGILGTSEFGAPPWSRRRQRGVARITHRRCAESLAPRESGRLGGGGAPT